MWTCKDGANNPVTVTNSAVTVGKNAQVTCEITNTRDLAKLAVVKKVDGGASVPADWKLSAIAAAPNAGKNIVDRAGNITTLAEVYAGTEYTLSENRAGQLHRRQLGLHRAPASPSTATATRSPWPRTPRSPARSPTPVTWPKLAVVKKVDGGASVPADWKLSAKADAPNAGKNIVDRAGNITTLAEVYAGTEYTLSENRAGQLHRQQLGLHRHRCHPERQQGHRRQERRGHLRDHQHP